MIASDSILALRTVVILFVLLFGRLAVWQIYLVNAIGSVFETSHGLAWSASVSLLVPKRHLARVNGLTGMFNSGTGMLAPAIAGLLYALIGMKGIAAIDLASWAFAVGPLLLVAIPSPTREPGPGGESTLLRDIREGWGHLRKGAGLFYLLLAYSAIGFFGITTEVLRGPYVLSFNGPDRYGIVESIASVGTLAGGFLLTAMGNPKRAIGAILASEALVSVAGMVMGAFPSYIVLVVSVLAYYGAVSFGDGSINALWQRTIPPAAQGRVFALRDALTMSLMPAGILLFSPIAEFWMEPALSPGGRWALILGPMIGTGPGRGIGLLFVLSGLASLSIVLLACCSRSIRRVDDQPLGSAEDIVHRKV